LAHLDSRKMKYTLRPSAGRHFLWLGHPLTFLSGMG
jgi:hypothetical protein